MSSVAIIGVVVVVALAVIGVLFLRCVAWSSSSGRHALGAAGEHRRSPSNSAEAPGAVGVLIDPDGRGRHGVGPRVDGGAPESAGAHLGAVT
ncbi:hypothetical protein [Amycolatopsis magusensis]|uniref:hypothetical protein n=1 Tax=Amycolatopsis magusensis TaxID=882444 RepID=UPI00379CDA6B